MLAPTSSVPTVSTTTIAPAARWPDRSAHRINGVAAPAVNAPMEDGMAKPSVGTRARSAGGRDRPMNSLAYSATAVAATEASIAAATARQAWNTHANATASAAAARYIAAGCPAPIRPRVRVVTQPVR